MNKIPITIHSSRPIIVEADADSFGQIFASVSGDEQVAIFRAMVEHMKPHKIQWDYIAIELEKAENRDVRRDLSVIFPEPVDLIATLQECEAYFDQRADADITVVSTVPNEEMKLLTAVRASIRELSGVSS